MNKTSREKEAVLNVFAAFVRPLMRVAFEYGISAGEIAGVVRRTFIQALEARLQEQKRPTTDARIAAMAGLPRSDVSSLRDALRTGAPHSMGTVSPERIGNVLTAWHTLSGFSGAYGLAMDLDLLPVAGSPRRSFKELAQVACPEADADALLDALVAAKSVELTEGGNTVRCVSRAYVSPTTDVTRIEQIGRFLEVVASNFAHNLLRGDAEPVYFERAVVSDERLSDGGRDKFLSAAGQKGQELLAELDTFLTQVAVSDSAESGKRYGLGIYFFEDQSKDTSWAKDRGQGLVAPSRKHVETAPPQEIQEIDVLAAVSGKKD